MTLPVSLRSSYLFLYFSNKMAPVNSQSLFLYDKQSTAFDMKIRKKSYFEKIFCDVSCSIVQRIYF